MNDRWYWVISPDNVNREHFIATRGNLDETIRDALLLGRSIGNWDSSRWVAAEAERDGVPDDALQEYLDIPIFSRRLRELLSAAGVSGIEYLPLNVLRHTGELIPGFAIANILAVIPALDLTRSDFDAFPPDYFLPARRGKVRALRVPVLRGDLLKDLDVVRLAEYPFGIYVGHRFREAFERGQCTGWSFAEVRLSRA